MKIEYRILWLDDKIQDFIDDELVIELQNHLIDEGFRPEIITTSNIEEFFRLLNDSYDLILTDYHMKGMNGDKVVEEIRKPERSIFTEILFYTAQADLKDTNKISRVSFLETNGRAGTHQEILIEETKKLIDLTIKKFQHIVAIRGMIMHETTFLDSEMYSIIKQSLTNNEFNFDDLAESIYNELISLYENKIKFIKACKQKKNFGKLTKDNFVYSAKYKILTIQGILNLLKAADFSNDYETEINNIRNKFAHAVLKKDEETGREYFQDGESGVTFNSELCKVIRKNINKHKTNLDSLGKRVSSS